MVQLNEYHQPIGPALPHWHARPRPTRCVLHRKHCRLKAVNPEQHGDRLYEAYSQAADARDWTYLSVAPFQNRVQFDEHLESISPAYAGKNALNRLRQLRGYQQGRYHKQWGSQRDNVHLAQLQARLPAPQDDYPELILHALQDTYDAFFMEGHQARNGLSNGSLPPPLSSR